METIKLGTIGSGMIARAILESAALTEGIALEAVYSRSEEKGRALAREFGCEKRYTDLDVFLRDGEINTVYIASPNLLHYPQAKAALLAGKNVICEKPFVTRFAEAGELRTLAAARGLYLIEAAPTAYLPNYAILRRELKKIGRVRLVLSNYSQYSSRYELLLKGEKPNVFNPAFAGGALMDINFYNILLNVLLFGSPRTASYHANRFGDLADTSGVAILDYGDFVSTNAGAKDTWGVNFFQIEGEEGFLYIEDGSNGLKSVRVVTRETDETYNDQPDPNRWHYEVRELTRRILAEDRPFFEARLDTTLETVALMEKLRLTAGLRFPRDEE